ncbi:hypothetical protein N7U66_00135 [Lacinutrix neustonica]|uniref:Tissue inhibitor of metalloproteinase n=1 Tax=Lacinutrix neustonica TaxID=2980107 RepID=A0A9E8SDY5_9FLAO|nr:hypothetical protein [Lacinutrix neustonica]WAC02237.1 hypothetical protein N7U66_00135 [Lacinutrix neustonica]
MKKIVLIIFILLFSITQSFACSCADSDTSLYKKIQNAFNESDLILTGKVIAKELKSNGTHQNSGDPIIYTIEIISVIKGIKKSEVIQIASEMSESNCGYPFEIGKAYLVYATSSTHFSSKTGNDFNFVTSLCYRNQKLSIVKGKEFRILKRLARRMF